MKNSKLKFSEYMQNISSSKSFGKFVLSVRNSNGYLTTTWQMPDNKMEISDCFSKYKTRWETAKTDK